MVDISTKQPRKTGRAGRGAELPQATANLVAHRPLGVGKFLGAKFILTAVE